jgi:acyl carrier protein phosphodiesterase
MQQLTRSQTIFKPVVGLYAGAFVDVVYDHFLAIDASQFPTNEALNTFAQNTYLHLQNNIQVMPLKFSSMMPYMQQQNWLYNYQFIWGIEKALKGWYIELSIWKVQKLLLKYFNNSTLHCNNVIQLFLQMLKKWHSNNLKNYKSYRVYICKKIIHETIFNSLLYYCV